MLGPFQPSSLPEDERVAFVASLAALAACDGAPTIDETLALLSRFDLDEVSPEGIRRACELVLDPPKIEAALLPLRELPGRRKVAVMAELLYVAQADGDPVPAETEALDKARAVLGLSERQVRRAQRRAAHEHWERTHGAARADGLDNLRNALVLAAGFGVPVGAIVHLGVARAEDPRLVLPAGVEALGQGFGPVAGVLVAMALSVAASALVSLVTLRGQRAARLERELLHRGRRMRANLRAIVQHLEARVHEAQFGGGPRAGLVAIEKRLQVYHRALTRLKSID